MPEVTKKEFLDEVIWHMDDESHQDDSPAIENPNSNKFWYRHGKYHQADGPIEPANLLFTFLTGK